MKITMRLIACVAMIAIVAGAMPAQAQSAKGLKAGLTMSTFTGSDAEVVGVSPDYRMGFAFGGYTSYRISPNLSFQPEAFYAMKGAKYEDGGDSLEFKFTYLQIPMLFVMQPAAGKGFFYAGPDVGIKLSSKVKAESGGISAEDDLEDVKSLDLGLTFGAGMTFSQYSLEARYTMGLTSFDDTTDPDDVKHSGFTFLFGMGL